MKVINYTNVNRTIVATLRDRGDANKDRPVKCEGLWHGFISDDEGLLGCIIELLSGEVIVLWDGYYKFRFKLGKVK